MPLFGFLYINGSCQGEGEGMIRLMAKGHSPSHTLWFSIMPLGLVMEEKEPFAVTDIINVYIGFVTVRRTLDHSIAGLIAAAQQCEDGRILTF